MAVAFVCLGEGRLWNARLLPFYYLGLYLLAAIGVAEVGRTIAVLVAPDPDRPSIVGPGRRGRRGDRWPRSCSSALPLRSLPGGDQRADGSYSWLLLDNGTNQAELRAVLGQWNYTGYEGKEAYGEYRDLVNTMRDVGAEHGCGRSFWEYEKEINRYGTPMALMLLPHWTDGCIGSMEGLFFEASATTPFHFLTQVELSAAPSAAQRDLPYGGFDLDQGVRHLQLMGVRYYLATSAQATTAARAHPDLTELATSGPWVIFEVADSELVEPLDNEPAVLDGQTTTSTTGSASERDANDKCAGPAVTWYLDPGHAGRVPRRVGSGGVAAGRSRRSRPRGAPRAQRRGVRTSRSTPTGSRSTSTGWARRCSSRSRTSPTGRRPAPTVRTGWPRT